jgi:release factor glutamine methyltransferase
LERRIFMTGGEISWPALQVAAGNARRLGAPVAFVACDLLAAVADRSQDLIVSNPPYVSTEHRETLQREVRDFEPEVALYAGPTGYEVYERLVAEAARVLRPDGWLVMELGYNSRDRVLELLGSKWRGARVVPDLSGIPRVLAAQLS